MCAGPSEPTLGEAPPTAAEEGPRELRVLTWNVWFAESCFEERARYLLRCCREADPDVACFQEATPRFLKVLRSDDFAYGYHVSDETPDGSTLRPYGVLMLCRRVLWPLYPHFHWHRLPTRMSRRLLSCELSIGQGAPWTLATVHLESLNSAGHREKQLGIIAEVIGRKGPSPAVLAGDFNFCRHWNFAEILAIREGRGPQRKLSSEDPARGSAPELENNMLMSTLGSAFVDAWAQLRPAEKGWTFDSERNTSMKLYEQMAYDRIMVANLQDGWQLWDVSLQGTEPFFLLPCGGCLFPACGSTDSWVRGFIDGVEAGRPGMVEQLSEAVRSGSGRHMDTAGAAGVELGVDQLCKDLESMGSLAAPGDLLRSWLASNREAVAVSWSTLGFPMPPQGAQPPRGCKAVFASDHFGLLATLRRVP